MNDDLQRAKDILIYALRYRPKAAFVSRKLERIVSDIEELQRKLKEANPND